MKKEKKVLSERAKKNIALVTSGCVIFVSAMATPEKSMEMKSVKTETAKVEYVSSSFEYNSVTNYGDSATLSVKSSEVVNSKEKDDSGNQVVSNSFEETEHLDHSFELPENNRTQIVAKIENSGQKYEEAKIQEKYQLPLELNDSLDGNLCRNQNAKGYMINGVYETTEIVQSEAEPDDEKDLEQNRTDV